MLKVACPMTAKTNAIIAGLLRQSLSLDDKERLVYLTLLAFVEPDGHVEISQQSLGQCACVGKNSVAPALKRLEQFGAFARPDRHIFQLHQQWNTETPWMAWPLPAPKSAPIETTLEQREALLLRLPRIDDWFPRLVGAAQAGIDARCKRDGKDPVKITQRQIYNQLLLPAEKLWKECEGQSHLLPKSINKTIDKGVVQRRFLDGKKVYQWANYSMAIVKADRPSTRQAAHA